MKRISSIASLLSLVTGTKLIVLVTVFAVVAMNAWTRERQSAEIAHSARVSRDIVLVREALRLELGVIDTTISEPAVAAPATVARLKMLHQNSLDALGYVEKQIAQIHNEKMPRNLAAQLARKMADFDHQLFPAILAAAALPREQRSGNLILDPQSSAYAMLDMVDTQAAILSRQIASTGSTLSEMMRIGDIAWHIRVEAGGERRFMGNFVAWPHKPSVADLSHLAEVKGRMEAPWQSIEQAVRDGRMPTALSVAIDRANREYFGGYARLRAQIVDRLNNGAPPGINGPQWLTLSTPALNSLMRVSQAALDGAEARALNNLEDARRDFRIAMMFMAICIGLGLVTVFLVLVRLIRPLKQITRAVTSNQDAVIAKALALSGRGDEIGQFALALETFRSATSERQRLENELVQNMAARHAAEGGQQGQVGIPGQHESRAAHAAQRRTGFFRTDAARNPGASAGALQGICHADQ